jgi:predicted metalloprotease with PDZ domain
MRRLPLLVLTILAAAALPQAAYAQTPSIEYTLTARNPLSHLYNVEMEIGGIRTTSVDVAMPAWSPGVYSIRDFAGNVQQFEVVTRQNQPLQSRQIDKQTWRITKSAGDDLVVRYRVYSSAFTDELADITPAAVFMYVAGQAQQPLSVRYDVPGDWKIESALEKQRDHYIAPDYDTLVSSPVFIGKLKVLEFKSGNIPYKVVFSNSRTQMTDLQIEADLNDLADAAAVTFGSVPFKHYTFFVKVQPTSGASSVGYMNSARVFIGENDFVAQNSYSAFLSVAAQAFTKAWYTRAARPRSMTPFDLSREAYSRNLWFTEGVSAYTADLLLLRSKILTSTEYFQKASAEVDALQHQAGRLLNSVEQASWNAWTRSENSINATVSYILKGKVAGLLLDAQIRGRTSGAKGLEDVVRHLLSNPSDNGLEDNALEPAIQRATGVDVREFFDSVVRDKAEIDYKRYLEPLGIAFNIQKSPASIFLGIEFERVDGNLARIRRVLPGSPAEAARLDGGDVIFAMDSERVTYDTMVSRIHSKALGKPVSLSVMRGDRLLALTITPGLTETEIWNLSEASTITPDQLRLRNAWKGLN